MRWFAPALAAALLALLPACDVEPREPRTTPEGQETSTETDLLKVGAEALQRSAPPAQLDIHLVGFHPAKGDPSHQMEAHHYCHQVNEDFAQCALFDASSKSANLNGIEYIISERLFETLPEEERQHWHPHNFEILSGQLVAPGLPATAELELMAGKMNSYGKTWHVWDTGGAHGEGAALPLGPPVLGWSFNADGQVAPGLVQARDEALGIDSDEVRRARQRLVPQARPQAGVDALDEAFPAGSRPPGVRAKAP